MEMLPNKSDVVECGEDRTLRASTQQRFPFGLERIEIGGRFEPNDLRPCSLVGFAFLQRLTSFDSLYSLLQRARRFSNAPEGAPGTAQRQDQ